MKLPLLLHVFLLSFISNSAISQTFSWAYGEGGLGSDVATAITHDNQGNIYVTGNVAGTIKFGNGFATGTVFEVFLAKYTAAGSLEWVKTYGGLNNEKAQGIAFHDNHLYVCGFFEGTAVFGNTTLTSAGGQDVFIMKTDLQGNVVWAKQAGGINSDVPNAIAVDNNGNAYVCGSYKTTLAAGNLNISTSNIFVESFVLSIDANGNFIWAKSLNGNGNNTATGVAFNNQGGISVCGYFGNRLSIDTVQLNTSSPSYDIYLASFDAAGNLNWMRKAGSSAEDQAYAVTCDATGNTYMVGYYGGEVTLGSYTLAFKGWNDAFLAKYDDSGNVLWARGAGGGNLDVATCVTLDDKGNCYVAGMFEGQADFEGRVISDADRGVFISGYDNDGNFRFVQAAGGVQTESALGITVHQQTAFITGYYFFTCSFGNIGVTQADNAHIFTAAYNIPDVTGLAVIELPSVNVYPNPANSVVRVESMQTFNKIQITNLFGSLLYSSLFDKATSGIVDVAELPSGIYMLELFSDNGRKQVRLIKQ